MVMAAPVVAFVAPAGASAPVPSGLPSAGPPALTAASFRQTWSVGPLAQDRNGPIAQSSPMVATLDGDGPSVVVGDRSGYLWAFHLSDGTPVAGWPVQVGAPIDSTPSVLPNGSGPGLAEVFVGSGNAFVPNSGGYSAFYADGARPWPMRPSVDPASDYAPAAGVEASITVADLQDQAGLYAGGLGQSATALSAASGRNLPGWPFFAADSTFSTAAAADLYGTGQTDLVVGGASTAGQGLGQSYPQGGHLRILNSRGGLICHYDTDQEVDSSPAVGAFLPGGASGIVVGTGDYYPNAGDTDTLEAFDDHCHQVWSDGLDGVTSSSPALADITGGNHLDVAEGTDGGQAAGTGAGTGSVWVIDPTTGGTVWHVPATGRVIGSIVTADLTGQGYQDLLVPTTLGTDVFDGRSGQLITVLSQGGYQNAPLVTRDPNGTIGITLAGYGGTNQGVLFHYEIQGSNGEEAVGSGSWPMFHHDPQLTGLAPAPGLDPEPACSAPAAARRGYDLFARDGGIFAFGQPFCGSTGGIRLARPIVGAAVAPDTGGYWMVASDGGIFTFGRAGFHGSTGGVRLAKPVVGMAPTADGQGYWLAAADGGVFDFGDAPDYGSLGRVHLTKPVVGITATADGRGYWLVTADGGVFSFGDARFQGSTGGVHLTRPIVGMAEDRADGGYWLVASDGGVFAFGAPFLGSTGGVHLTSPIVGIDATEDGQGYWMVAADGGVFGFGDAGFHGSTGGVRLAQPVVGMVGLQG